MNTNVPIWKGVSYADKDWRGIRKRFMKPRYSKKRVLREGKQLLSEDVIHPPPFGPRLKRTVPTGQDAITALALWQKGLFVWLHLHQEPS